MKIAPSTYLLTLSFLLVGCGGESTPSSSGSVSAPSVSVSSSVAYDYDTNRYCAPFSISARELLERDTVRCEDALNIARGMTKEEYDEFLKSIGMSDGFFGDNETYARIQELAGELPLCPLPSLSAPHGSYFEQAEETLRILREDNC